ncbi:MAG TPA: hypothetical protein VGG39_30315 [Polyangiaceae bacterium]|jgi:hypothetical protein
MSRLDFKINTESGKTVEGTSGTIESIKMEVGGAPFLFPREIEAKVAEVLQGKYDYGHLPDAPKVRRILDLRAGVGAFALWAWHRWRNSWVECYEPDPDTQMFLRHNLPPGGAVHPLDVRDPGVVSALPPCDVIRLDAGGGEADLLKGYGHQPSIVCFEWHRQEDRLQMEATLSSWGLRCFKLSFKHADLGHAAWVRSKAVWNTKRKAYRLP